MSATNFLLNNTGKTPSRSWKQYADQLCGLWYLPAGHPVILGGVSMAGLIKKPNAHFRLQA